MNDTTPIRRPTGTILLEFFGSMNLAITLLGILAISSVIGTVLKQNEAYEDYIIKFGSFWFEVYKTLGLYDVYSASWFLLILTFLVASTSVCIYRNGPGMLREMRNFRENVTGKSLRAYHNTAEWNIPHPAAAVLATTTEHLASYGYRIRPKEYPDHTVLAAMKGAVNRIGYLCAHIGIVVICIGGLLDGNMPLKLAALSGKVRPETRVLPFADVPEISRLPVDNASFRGRADIAEGTATNHIEVKLRDGYLLQKLPFSIEVKDFRVEHYPSGQPKNFESDLVIYDPATPKPLHQTISVNHPWIYKGYSIYQANFGDGGSTLHMQVWPLLDSKLPAQATSVVVGKSVGLQGPQGPLTVELVDFRTFNVNPAPPGSGKKFRDLGPNFTYKLRDANGIALEYENYMAPVEQQGRLFFISGMRTKASDDYRYIHIPVDAQGSVERFMHFRTLLQDQKILEQAAIQVVGESLQGSPAQDNDKVKSALVRVLGRLLERFNLGGFDAVAQYLQANLPKDRAAQAVKGYTDLLQRTLAKVYDQVVAQEGVKKVAASATEEQNSQFFEDAVNALGVMPNYGSPFYLQLVNFDEVQASGLQITRSPGKNVVYLGFGLLIVGVFTMFYLPQRRLWAWLKQEADGVRLVFAGTSHRDQISFTTEFNTISQSLEARLKAL